jgi:membrane protein implicated in regulation of membrane protease activity
MLSQASRTLATSILIVGLLLIGFGTLILAMPELFAFLAAAVFFIAGVACALAALKMFWAQWRFEKRMSHDEDAYRENVVIHRDEFHDS